MSPDHPTDEALLARLRAGDEHAYELLYARYRGRLVRYAERMLGPGRPGAEDAAQEAFLRAHRSLHDTGRELHVGAWLYRVVRNVCLDELRRKAFAPIADPGDAAAAADDTHGLAARRETLREVVGDLLALPPSQRGALVALAFDGATHADTSARTGCSVAASRNLVNRARRQLAEARAARAVEAPRLLEAA